MDPGRAILRLNWEALKEQLLIIFLTHGVMNTSDLVEINTTIAGVRLQFLSFEKFMNKVTDAFRDLECYNIHTRGLKADMMFMSEHEEALCPICLQNVPIGDEVVVLPCQHWYHPECWEHMGRWDPCPYCRRPCSEQSVEVRLLSWTARLHTGQRIIWGAGQDTGTTSARTVWEPFIRLTRRRFDTQLQVVSSGIARQHGLLVLYLLSCCFFLMCAIQNFLLFYPWKSMNLGFSLIRSLRRCGLLY